MFPNSSSIEERIISNFLRFLLAGTPFGLKYNKLKKYLSIYSIATSATVAPVLLSSPCVPSILNLTNRAL